MRFDSEKRYEMSKYVARFSSNFELKAANEGFLEIPYFKYGIHIMDIGQYVKLGVKNLCSWKKKSMKNNVTLLSLHGQEI